MTEYKVPLQKRFANFINKGVVFPIVVGAMTALGGLSAYEASDYDWDMDVTDRREAVLTDFKTSMKSLDSANSEYKLAKSNMTREVLRDAGKKHFKKMHDTRLAILTVKTNQYMQAALSSYDINEKDVQNLAYDFNQKGFAEFTPLSIDPSDANTRNEMRKENLPAAPTQDNYQNMVDAMDTCGCKRALPTIGGGFGGLGLSIFIMTTLLASPTVKKWKELPNKRKNRLEN